MGAGLGAEWKEGSGARAEGSIPGARALCEGAGAGALATGAMGGTGAGVGGLMRAGPGACAAQAEKNRDTAAASKERRAPEKSMAAGGDESGAKG